MHQRAFLVVAMALVGACSSAYRRPMGAVTGSCRWCSPLRPLSGGL